MNSVVKEQDTWRVIVTDDPPWACTMRIEHYCDVIGGRRWVPQRWPGDWCSSLSRLVSLLIADALREYWLQEEAPDATG